MARPNRLERTWPRVRVDILNRWSKITEEEVDSCEFKFDKVVELIRRNYYPGRSHLTIEGDVRDWLNEKIEGYLKEMEVTY